MALEIFETSGQAVAATPLFNALVVSEKGGGKTTFCSGFPDPLFLDFDGGLASVVDVPGLKYIPPNLLTYENVLELGMAITRRTHEGKIALRLLDGGKYIEREVAISTLVIDSITKGHRMFLNSAMALGNRKLPAIQDWGLASDRIVQFIDMVKPYVHLLVTAHFEIIKDANLERVMAQIRMPGQLVDLLPISLDEFWRIKQEIDMQKRRRVTLWTVNDGIYPASTRYSRRGMPAIIDITDDPPGSRNFFKTVMDNIKPVTALAKP